VDVDSDFFSAPRGAPPTAAASPIDPGFCDIDVRPALSVQEFRERYAGKAPVVFSAGNVAFQLLTAKGELLRNFGHQEVVLSSSNAYSHEKRRVALREYLLDLDREQALDERGDQSFYMFGDNFGDAWDPLYSHYCVPRFAGHTNALSFGAGRRFRCALSPPHFPITCSCFFRVPPPSTPPSACSRSAASPSTGTDLGSQSVCTAGKRGFSMKRGPSPALTLTPARWSGRRQCFPGLKPAGDHGSAPLALEA
jgi:hypothetical protein